MPPIGGIPTRAPAPRSAAASSDATHFAPTSAPVHNAPRPSAAASSDATHFAPTSAPVHNAPHSPTWHLAAVAPSASPDARHQAAQALINVANAAHAVTHSIVPQLNPASETVAGAREALAHAGTIHGLDVNNGPHVSQIVHSGGIPTAALALGAKAAGAVTPDVEGAVTGLKLPTGVLGRFVHEVGNLPMSTAQALAGFGVAAGSDIVHGRTADLNPIDLALGAAGVEHGTAIQRLLHQAAVTDPVYRDIKTGSFKPSLHDPLGTFLDATGIYGVAGDAAGAVARTGALGDTIKGAASLAREDRLAAAGVPGSTVARGASRNLFTNIAQKQIVDRLEGKLPVTVQNAISDARLRKQVANLHASEMGQKAAERTQAIKTMNKVKPNDKVTAGVSNLATGYGVGPEQFPALRDEIASNLDTIRDPEAKANAERNLANLNAAIEHGVNEEQLAKVPKAYAPLQAQREADKAHYDLKEEEQMAQGLMKRVALQHPDVKTIDPVVHPELKQALQEAKSAKVEAEADLARAQKEAAVSKGAHAGASSTLAQVQRAMPVSPVTDLLQDKVIDLRDMLEQSKAAAPQFHGDRVNFLKDVVNEKRADLEDVRKQISGPGGKLQGTVIHDPEAAPILSGKYRGQRLRPLNEADYQRITADLPHQPSYVSAASPSRKTVPSLADRLSPGATIRRAELGNKEYTGQALDAGTLQPGHDALLGSQLRDINAISRQRELHAFIDRFSAHGYGYGDEAEAKNAAKMFTAEYGIKAEPVEFNGEYHVVPSSAAKEMVRQRQMDTPSRLERTLLTTPNKVMRKTVLPFSPKLPIMHTAESLTRMAALEGSPLGLVRAPLDYARWRRVLKTVDPETANRLKAIVTPGSLSHTGEGELGEALTGVPTEMHPVILRVRQALHAADAAGSKIIQGQRFLEKSSQYVAAGAHMRRLYQEMGHSWVAANLRVRKLAEDTAAGQATAAEAERTAKAVHDTMGQYNAFTSGKRMALRFMPFGSWAGNSLKLIYMTLPRDHPLFSALLHDIQVAQAPQWNASHKGLPSDMQGTIAEGGGKYFDFGKFLPTGSGEPIEQQAASLFMPAQQSVFDPLIGKGPYGQDLASAKDKFKKAVSPAGIFSGTWAGRKEALLAALEGGLEESGGPANTIARAAYGHGGTLYNADTPVIHLLTGQGPIDVKKGTGSKNIGFLGGLQHGLNPFKVTNYHPPGSTTSKAKGGFNYGGSKATGGFNYGSTKKGAGGFNFSG